MLHDKPGVLKESGLWLAQIGSYPLALSGLAAKRCGEGLNSDPQRWQGVTTWHILYVPAAIHTHTLKIFFVHFLKICQ